uniref:hypothetical protein n=1 Tax=uncultured Arcobacter sp. TaxID=165434 RepID=UPI00262410DE
NNSRVVDSSVHKSSIHNSHVVDSSVDNQRTISFSNVGSESGTLTVFKNTDDEIICNRGCFNGTLAEFEKAVDKKDESDKSKAEYKLLIEMIKIRYDVK